MKDAKCPNCSNYGKAPNFNDMLNQPLELDDDFNVILLLWNVEVCQLCTTCSSNGLPVLG